MERKPDQVYQHIEEVEELAEHILINKDEVVQLDKRRNKNREALRALDKQSKVNPMAEKSWMCLGNMFLKMPSSNAKELITQDQTCLDQEINKLRIEMKNQVNRLRDLEGKPELKGFNLNPLTKEEKEAIYKIAN